MFDGFKRVQVPGGYVPSLYEFRRMMGDNAIVAAIRAMRIAK